MKKILMLSDASSTHTYKWYRAYEGMGFEVHLLSFEEPIENIPNFYYIKTLFNTPKYILGLQKVKKLIDRIKPSILLPHFIPNYGLLAYLSGNLPYILTIWGSDLLLTPFKGWLQFHFTRLILKSARWIIVDAKFMKEILTEKFNVPHSKIYVIPFGVESSKRKKRKSKTNVNNRPIGILTYRRMEPVYNPFTILNALKKFKGFERKGFYVDWVGEGALGPRLRETIYKEGLFDVVRMNGYVSSQELIDLLLKDEIYLSASFSDGTSVSLLESMNFGLFPVVSDIQGNREWILDGINGFLFDPNNPHELYEKLRVSISDSSLRESAKRVNQKIIELRANWEKNLSLVNKLIRDVI